jgi:Squalene-hopene cyclase C-terminal domain
MRNRAEFKILQPLARSGVILAFATLLGIGRAADDDGRESPPGNQKIGSETIHNAVVRALPLLVKASAQEYPKHRECFSCHNQAVPAVALSLAQKRGFDIGALTLRSISEHTESDLSGALDDYRKGSGQPGGVIRAGYALWALEAGGWAPDEVTSGVAHYLSVVQSDRKRWPPRANRPPSESSAFTATALALRGVRAFGPTASGEAPAAKSQPGMETVAAQRARALEWLEQNKPTETEDRVFRLWGLKEAGASGKSLAAAALDLWRTQRADGGWSQLDTPAEPAKTKGSKGKINSALTSDAYATGSALVALHLAGGVPTDDPAYRKGLDFLLRTQRTDGTWFIKSRSRPFQTYFESGFPHGPDQFISVAGSGWATAALVLACPAP